MIMCEKKHLAAGPSVDTGVVEPITELHATLTTIYKSKPIFAPKYAFFSINFFENYKICNPLHRSNFKI